MLGWKLFLRALSLLVENLGAALRLSALPYALVVVASVWAVSSGSSGLPSAMEDPVTGEMVALSLPDLLVALLSLFASLWIAVQWHRYVLLSESPEGWVPPFNGPEVLGYLGRSILIGLLVVLVMLAISTMVAVLVLPLFGTAATGVVGAAALFVAMILFYRLAIVLPAGSIGRKMTLGEAMTITRGHSGTVVVLALLTVGFSFLLQVPTMLDGGGTGPITVVYQLVVQWIALLLGVGTLTALYGHLVEGRPVD